MIVPGAALVVFEPEKKKGISMFWRVVAFLAVVMSTVVWVAAKDEPGVERLPALAGEGRSKVVLELFTSEGCSSCPAADRLLSRIGNDETYRSRVVPLAYHVDYWDYIGWKDPFASKLYTRRQNAYAEAFHLSSLYTPQLVIQGRAECVGSNESRIVEEIRKRQSESARASVTLSRNGADVDVNVVPSSDLGRCYVMAAIFENELETAVRRGENAGRKLRHDFVVRRLERLGIVEGTAPVTFRLSVQPESGWVEDHLGVAVFLQDAESLEIRAAESVEF
jgi:hypothetical protein